MGEWYWYNGIDFKVTLGAYPSYKGDACGKVYVTFVYDGKKDKLNIIQFGVKGGFSCGATVKSPLSSKDEIPAMFFMEDGKLMSKKQMEDANSNSWYWGISKEQTWEEIEARLIDTI